MRKIIYGFFLLVGFIASGLGLGKQEIQASPAQTVEPVINHACADGLVFSDVLNNQEETLIAGHYSHSSHRSHSSHSSHYSSRY